MGCKKEATAMETNKKTAVMIETSARHVHLSKADLEILFGEGYALSVKKELSQPGQFASYGCVDVVGSRGTLKGVMVLGPTRAETQVEISLTDARAIGIVAPIRESGDLAGAASCTLVGEKGSLLLKEGVIAAKRHIHMTPEDGKQWSLQNGQRVAVVCKSEGRELVFRDTVVRIHPQYKLAMHIDTDESNAVNGCNIGTVFIKE